ncbi:hypothetical protein BLL37_17220 [Pseudomonas azotoformans]|uniref:Uncharacterized protein n=1 Tax=Pseudomonas azotoformans TaxID=47878 RepID=A0A1V2JE40_PSEAZ|nr:hypothetical protein BLL37_17220 [Pseudomonas azotoformans]
MQCVQFALDEPFDKRLFGAQANGIGLTHDSGQRGKLFQLDGGREVDAPAEIGQQFADARRDQRRGQRVAEQVVGGQAVFGQQRVPRTAEKHAAPRRQGQGLEVRVGLEVTYIGDKEFDLFTAQAAREFFPVVHLQHGAHFGVSRDEPRHGLGRQVHRGHGVAAEAHFTGVEFGHARDFMAQQGRALHQAQRVLQHHLAFGGGAQVFMGAVHQHAAELLLQALDAAAEGGLGDAHGVRRTHEATVLVQRDEVAQLAKVHGVPGIL